MRRYRAIRPDFADASLAQRQVRLGIDAALVSVQPKCSPRRRQRDAFDTLDELLALQAIADQIRDGTHLQAMLDAEFFKIGPAGHFAVGLHDFADDGGRFQPRQARQIDAAFGLPGTNQHASVAGAQRMDMAGPQQIARMGVVINRHFDRLGLILHADAGGDAKLRMGIDGHGKSGAQLGGVMLDLAMKVQFIATLAGNRQADQPARVGQHEVNRLRRHFLGGIDDIPLILTVFIIDQDNGLAELEFFQDFRDRGKRHRSSPLTHKLHRQS